MPWSQVPRISWQTTPCTQGAVPKYQRRCGMRADDFSAALSRSHVMAPLWFLTEIPCVSHETSLTVIIQHLWSLSHWRMACQGWYAMTPSLRAARGVRTWPAHIKSQARTIFGFLWRCSSKGMARFPVVSKSLAGIRDSCISQLGPEATPFGPMWRLPWLSITQAYLGSGPIKSIAM